MKIEDYLLSLYKLDEIENFIIKLAKETVTPILSPLKCKILSTIVSLKKPKKCLEIGLGIGASTYAILKELDERSELISIDKNFHRVEIFYEKVYKKFPKEFREKLKVYPIDAIYVFEIFKSLNKKFDFIFIDSQKRDYYSFYPYLKILINQNGVIVIDNITYKEQIYKKLIERSEKYMEGVKLLDKFNRLMINDNEFNASFIPVEDGMGVFIKL